MHIAAFGGESFPSIYARRTRQTGKAQELAALQQQAVARISVNIENSTAYLYAYIAMLTESHEYSVIQLLEW